MNQQIYNLHRFLSEEGVPCQIRTMVGTARIAVGDLMILHSDEKKCFLVRPFGKTPHRFTKPGTVLKFIKEHNGHNAIG